MASREEINSGRGDTIKAVHGPTSRHCRQGFDSQRLITVESGGGGDYKELEWTGSCNIQQTLEPLSATGLPCAGIEVSALISPGRPRELDKPDASPPPYLTPKTCLFSVSFLCYVPPTPPTRHPGSSGQIEEGGYVLTRYPDDPSPSTLPLGAPHFKALIATAWQEVRVVKNGNERRRKLSPTFYRANGSPGSDGTKSDRRLDSNIKEQGAEGVTLPIPAVEGEVIGSQPISQNCCRRGVK
ncbi:unnamed protein product [Pleuronectes platessa]|uniref:Uncharacterized protein n=1 Tax=Pleuronectes platessa TaxID=8262 RepID=A0A9N7U819_PLEPL|nr:unnamed protein product [Pleuronectes platessa]